MQIFENKQLSEGIYLAVEVMIMVGINDGQQTCVFHQNLIYSLKDRLIWPEK